MPHLQPPTETDLEASQKALEAKYDEAAALLQTLQESTDAVATSLDEQRSEIDKEIEQVREAVREMREGEKKRDEWAQNIGRQVDEMARSLPGVSRASHRTQLVNATDAPHRACAAPGQASLGAVLVPDGPPDRTPLAQVPPHRAPPHPDLDRIRFRPPCFVPLCNHRRRHVTLWVCSGVVEPPVRDQAAGSPRVAAQGRSSSLEQRFAFQRFECERECSQQRRGGRDGEGSEREWRVGREAGGGRG